MINNSDDFTRRILTFPAIRPSESTSPATLFDSLINLSHSITSYKSKFCASNNRNTKQSILLIENLLIFLEEIRQKKSKIPISISLILSELHFALQKLRFLLEDCTREDARLWILMNSDLISSQFRDNIRSIGVALDVLQLDSIDLADEVRELIEFTRKQAFKMKFEVDSDDKRVSDRVFSILKKFEEQIVPDRSDLKWVLDRLGIERWSDCNGEIKFFELEIGFECLKKEKEEMEIMSRLMGFMIYCRCVLFDFVEDKNGRRKFDANFRNKEVIGCLNSEDFRCPISLEIMADPVTVSTGITYDRQSILKWFSAGNATCPTTGERLRCTDLVPNLSLKRLIKQFCCENGVRISESGERRREMKRTASGVSVSGSLAGEEAMEMAADFLVSRLAGGSTEEKIKAGYEIRLLTKTSVFNRICFVKSGLIPHLLDLLFSTDSSVQEHAIASLLNLSKNSKSRTIIIDNGGAKSIVHVLQEGINMEARQHAAGVLFYLASVEEYREAIGANPATIPALSDLLREGSDRAKKNALIAIYSLLMCDENRQRVLTAGIVPQLFHLLSQREDLTTDALAILSTLAEKLDGAISIVESVHLPITVQIFAASTSRSSKEHCVSLLLSLCINGGLDVISVLAKNRSIMEPLYSVLTDGTARASKKASSLIRILHEFNDKSSSGMINRALPQERFIHVR